MSFYQIKVSYYIIFTLKFHTNVFKSKNNINKKNSNNNNNNTNNNGKKRETKTPR